MNMNNPRQFQDVRAFWRPMRDRPLVLRGANITTAGRHNRKIILQTVRERGEATCGELADLTGLTRPAVFKIARGLVEEGLVTRARLPEKTLGQPTHALKLNPDAAFSFGLHIDRSHLTLVVVNFAGQVMRRFHQAGDFTRPEQARAFIAESIASLKRDNSSIMSRIAGFGAAVSQGLELSPNQSVEGHWCGINLSDLLDGVITTRLVQENAAAAAAIGEMLSGAGRGVDSFFYLFIDAGASGGLVIDRQYVRGAHGRSGEIGFLPQINPLRSSRTNLQKTLGNADLTGDLLNMLHDNGYVLATIATLDQLDEMGQAVVGKWIEAVADYLYLPLLNILCVVDPEVILVGGLLPRGLTKRLCYRLSERLSMHVGAHWPQMAVKPASVLVDAAAVGAAVMAFQPIWDSA
ncbi:MAG TPA: ROK family transcriptional regulator [Asticcacaulis sp.]|nr:ROK family transcriptional regulator [Asticcacaulis sp.]